ncbi:MAG: type II toxin-antitoxin system Phd/YefM family antitoxin [Candidatus Dormibacteria bacterium]
MTDIPARDLRNQVSAILRRVEGGECLRVTVSGRPVAELRPLTTRPRAMAWSTFFEGSQRWLADPGLALELRRLLPGATDELSVG